MLRFRLPWVIYHLVFILKYFSRKCLKKFEKFNKKKKFNKIFKKKSIIFWDNVKFSFLIFLKKIRYVVENKYSKKNEIGYELAKLRIKCAGARNIAPILTKILPKWPPSRGQIFWGNFFLFDIKYICKMKFLAQKMCG